MNLSFRVVWTSDHLGFNYGNSKFWQSKSAEALSRTLIDLVLFDRLEAHQEESAARRFIIRGEQSINTPTVDPTVIISGFADYYAMGYDNAVQPKFESCSIVVEAKKGSTYNTALPQAVAYLSGIQSKRAALNPKRMIDTVYGIVSDGYIWQFLRLDNKKLFTSSIYRAVVAEERTHIVTFVDNIIAAGIELSPHTTPKRHFPSHSTAWHQNIESRILEPPLSPSKQKDLKTIR
jgi:hypothetical protein